MILLTLAGLWCTQASAEDGSAVNALGFTLVGDVNLRGAAVPRR